MRRDGTDDDYYVEAADYLSGSECKEVFFATKTPVVMLPTELHTQHRADYLEAISEGLARGRVRGHYCFSLGTTAERLVSLCSPDAEVQARYLNHLKEALVLREDRGLDLRVTHSQDFLSGLVGENQGMIHFKKPGTQETSRVEFVSGSHLRQYEHHFAEVFASARPLDKEVLMELLTEVKRAHLRAAVERYREALEAVDVRTKILVEGALKRAVESQERPTRKQLADLVSEHAAYRGIDLGAISLSVREIVEALGEAVLGSVFEVGRILELDARQPWLSVPELERRAVRAAAATVAETECVVWHWEWGKGAPATEAEAKALEKDKGQYDVLVDRRGRVWVKGERAEAVRGLRLRLLCYFLRRVGERCTVRETLDTVWSGKDLYRDTNVIWETLSRVNRALRGFYFGAFVRRLPGRRAYWVDRVCEKSDKRSLPYYGHRLRYCLIEREELSSADQ